MNVKEAKKFIPMCMNTEIVPFIWGESGIGKTEVVKQIAEENGLKLTYLTFGAVEDVGDLIGLPNFVTIDDVEVTRHAAPDWFPTEPNHLIFIDEFNRAKPQILQAMFPFVLEGRLHTHKLPDNCYIVVAGNPPTDDYDVTPMEDNALFSRFCHVKFTPTVNEWLSYMKKKKRNAGLIEFFTKNEEYLNSNSTTFDIRTVTKQDRRNAEKLAVFLDRNNPNKRMISIAANGFFGPEIGVQFCKFLEERNDMLFGDEVLNTFSKDTVKKIKKNINRIDLLNKALEDAYRTVETEGEITVTQSKNVAAFLTEIPNDLSFKGAKLFLELGLPNCTKYIGENKKLLKKFEDRD
jgi:hypothetical protein